MYEKYRYVFLSNDSLGDIESTLMLSLLCVRSLHGDSQVRLDAGHYFDRRKRACVIDSGTEVGRDINRVFVGLIEAQFGPDAFRVERVEGSKLEHAEV